MATHTSQGRIMVHLTRLGGPVFALNPDLIERAEATPDTVVTLVNGSKYVIRESLEELTELITAFRARVIGAAHTPDLRVVAPAADDHDGDVDAPAATDRPEHLTNVLPLRHGEQ
ncbi:MAG: flagellar FlbD family protein [Jatrophihabitans sp.]|uniref:flagellar FlbD family protein n=1 Tax=Jatrophihabitans sp. TaxID=1932789 RepID=UPI003F7DE6EA